jgi:CRISPR-associated exonuclease Cas4
MFFLEDDLLPISALQHLLYCDRQCALIHIERLWAENQATVEGRNLHNRAHAGKAESRKANRQARSLMVRSLTLGIWGQTDVVEFQSNPNAPPAPPFPVEYKRGKPKAHDADRVQLCAQALCLEEMLGVSIPAGALFYGRTRRRQEVALDPSLRQITLNTIDRLHELISSRRTPHPIYEKTKCEPCSLKNLCLPEANRSAERYLRRSLELSLLES